MATYTAAAVGGNWDNPATWGGAGVPTTGDIVLFNQTSGPVTVTAGAVCSELNLNSGTGYQNTITFANELRVDATAAFSTSGNITLSSKSAAAGFAMVGPNGIWWVSTGNLSRIITSFTVPFNLPFRNSGNGGNTLQLTGDFTVSDFGGAAGTLNGSNLIINGNVTLNAAVNAGTSSCILSGATTIWSAGTLHRVIINSPGTVTISGSVSCFTSITRTAGTLVATGSTITFIGNLITLPSGQVLNNLLMSFGGSPVVISNNLTVAGNLQLPNGTGAFNGPGKIFVGGNLTNNNTSGGTCIIEMNGTGSISGSTYGNHIIINSPGGIITVGTTLAVSVSTFTLTAGTLNLANELQLNSGTLTISPGFNFSGSSNLRISANIASITSNGVAWPTSIIMANAQNIATAITLNDPLTVTGSFTSSSTQPNAVSLNGSTLSIRGDLTVTKAFGGSADIFIIGAGTSTWTGNGLAFLGCNLTINKTSGNVTLSGTPTFGNGKTLTYTAVSGTFSTAGSTLLLSTCSVRSNGVNWGNINGSSNLGNSIITLLDNMACNSITGFGSFNSTWNGFNMNINGDINISSAGIFGSTVFNILGTGNQAWAGGRLANPVKINKSTGTFTMSNTCTYGNGTGTNPLFEHIDGPVVTTGSTFLIGGNCEIKSNVSDPDAIVFNNLGFQNQAYTATLIDNMTINSFTPSEGGQGGGSINGNTLFIKGDITIGALGTSSFFGGTTIFNISGTGTQTWNSTATSTLRNSIVINKASGTLNLNGAIRWGFSGTTLTYNQGTVNPGTSTFTSTSLSIFNLTASGFSLYDWTPAIGTQTINTRPLVVTNNLIISGNTAFTGTRGFTCQNLSCTTVASVITLENATASPSAEYIVSGSLTLLGAAGASRITLQSSGSATFSGTITPVGQLNYISGTIPTSGMTLSHETAPIPNELFQLLPARPVITGGVSPTFTIAPPATGTIGTQFSMRAGYKAKFTLTSGATQSVAFVTTQDIDSSNGVFIYPSQSSPETNIFRTLYWGELLPPENTAVGWLSVT